MLPIIDLRIAPTRQRWYLLYSKTCHFPNNLPKKIHTPLGCPRYLCALCLRSIIYIQFMQTVHALQTETVTVVKLRRGSTEEHHARGAEGVRKWSTCKQYKHTNTNTLAHCVKGVLCSSVANYNVWSAAACSNIPGDRTVNPLLPRFLSKEGGGLRNLCGNKANKWQRRKMRDDKGRTMHTQIQLKTPFVKVCSSQVCILQWLQRSCVIEQNLRQNRQPVVHKVSSCCSVFGETWQKNQNYRNN